MQRSVIVPRGVNVGGRVQPMAALKAAVVATGLAPAAIDKIAGSTGTAHNWNTVGKLIELVHA